MTLWSFLLKLPRGILADKEIDVMRNVRCCHTTTLMLALLFLISSKSMLLSSLLTCLSSSLGWKASRRIRVVGT